MDEQILNTSPTEKSMNDRWWVGSSSHHLSLLASRWPWPIRAGGFWALLNQLPSNNCMCMHIYVCTYIYIYMYIHYICMQISMYVYKLHTSTSIYIYIHMIELYRCRYTPDWNCSFVVAGAKLHQWTPFWRRHASSLLHGLPQALVPRKRNGAQTSCQRSWGSWFWYMLITDYWKLPFLGWCFP